MGNDNPESLLGCPRSAGKEAVSPATYERLRMAIPRAATAGEETWNFSAFLLGSGDARHLYSSLIDISTQLKAFGPHETENARDEGMVKGPEIHFTLVAFSSLISECWNILTRSRFLVLVQVDVHPTTIAKNLVFLHALDDLSHFSEAERNSDPKALDLLAALHLAL